MTIWLVGQQREEACSESPARGLCAGETPVRMAGGKGGESDQPSRSSCELCGRQTSRKMRLCSMCASGQRRLPEGQVWASCWCEGGLVPVPLEWVGVRTAACGRDGCGEKEAI